VFQVIATSGDTRLGGDDLDRAVAEWIEARLDLADPVAVRPRLLEAAREAKEALSGKERVEILLPFLEGSASHELSLTREEFETLALPFVRRTRSHCLRALADAKITESGGGTQRGRPRGREHADSSGAPIGRGMVRPGT